MPNSSTPAPDAAAQTITLPAWVVATLMVVLMAVGLALATVTLFIWRTPGISATSHESNTAVVHSITTSPAPSASPSPDPGAATVAPVTTSSDSRTTTTKETSQQGLPSDAIVGTLLGTAAILFLTGAFFPRITKISLSGVGEIDLALASQITEKLTAHVGARLKQTSFADIPTPGAVSGVSARTAAATSIALETARRIVADPKNYGVKHASLTDSDIDFVRTYHLLPDAVADRVVVRALEGVKFPSPDS